MIWLVLMACQHPEVPPEATEDSEIDTDRPTGAITFGFPLPERELFTIRIGVDHDPVVQEPGFSQAYCTDYQGRPFPNCYDEHRGSDYMLDGGFETMDAGSANIVAAADGVVIDVESDHYDRCHTDSGNFSVTCDGNPIRANFVILEHEGGYRTWYWHMMTDSPTVAIGDQVACGDVLGKVGSSGQSSGPHLHFELRDPEGNRIDPYAGPESQPETYWQDQRAGDEFPGPGCAAP